MNVNVATNQLDVYVSNVLQHELMRKVIMCQYCVYCWFSATPKAPKMSNSGLMNATVKGDCVE